MPRGVYDKLKEFANTWATLGVRAWGAGWWDLKGVVGDKMAPLMGAPAGSVLVHENASIANSILFSALDFGDTRRHENPSSPTTRIFLPMCTAFANMIPAFIEVQMVHSHDGRNNRRG